MTSALPLEVRLFDQRRCLLGEGPVWDAERRRALWVDILNSKVLWRGEDDDGEFVLPAHVGAVLPTDDGRWLACLADGLYVMDLGEGSPERVAAFPHRLGSIDRPLMRANDAKVSPEGVAYCGTMSYTPDEHPGAGSLYCLDEGRLVTVVEQATISNGIGWSPDGSVIYFVDSPTGRIDQATYKGPGEPLKGSTFATIDAQLGLPDGLSVDAEGCVWLAVWGAGRVMKFDPNGQLQGFVEVPCAQTTSCAFVGDDLTTLIITTAMVGVEGEDACGRTYAVDVPVPGLPQPKVTL